MKILFTNYSEVTSSGGVHKTMREIAKNLSLNGHEVTILQGNPSDLPENEIYEGYRIIRLNLPLANKLYGLDIKIHSYLKKHLIELKPDIIHVHGYHTLFSPSIIYGAKIIEPNIPIIFSPYLDISRSTFLGRFLWEPYNFAMKRFITRYISCFISCSLFEQNTLMKIFNLNSDILFRIPLGVKIIKLD
jgi:glycosyltransferase involved in cell wall biosynthesis